MSSPTATCTLSSPSAAMNTTTTSQHIHHRSSPSQEKKQKSRCKWGKEKKCDTKAFMTHKDEAHVKTEVDKRICRDILCTTHYQRPIILPSSSTNNLPLPPLFPQPDMQFYHHQRSMMYPPPPAPSLWYGNYHGMSSRYGY
ncbi:hypothetical protein L6452_30852 [Arctium lappa]|uniref:Uncharacterized protein n=1 Tax=Arctium lappa TaxID=4217 RepID=A0ACB8ZKB2_ARCLA|nr:hypothetical protein L6452_30852 [Arctium lappa]